MFPWVSICYFYTHYTAYIFYASSIQFPNWFDPCAILYIWFTQKPARKYLISNSLFAAARNNRIVKWTIGIEVCFWFVNNQTVSDHFYRCKYFENFKKIKLSELISLLCVYTEAQRRKIKHTHSSTANLEWWKLKWNTNSNYFNIFLAVDSWFELHMYYEQLERSKHTDWLGRKTV